MNIRQWLRILLISVFFASNLATFTAAQAAESPFQRDYQSLVSLDSLESVNRKAPMPEAQVEANPNATQDNQALKIGVTQDGMYRLTPGDLITHGFDLTGVDPSFIQVSNKGQEIPIYLQEDGNGSFDGSDILLFYGTAITDIYTTENVYWLTVGATPGLRMATRSVTPGAALLADQFPVTLHAEQDTFYWQTMPNGEGQDHWFWNDRISPNSGGLPTFWDYPFSLNNIDPAATSQTVRVQLKGFTSVTTVNPDHKTQISINGTVVGSADWDSFSVFDLILTYPTSLLNEGANTLRVTALDSGAPVDQYLVNFFEIGYKDTYVAENNELVFGAPTAGEHRFQVTNFDSQGVSVFDITDPNQVVYLDDVNIQDDGGKYQAEFEDTVTLDTRYLALTPARYKQPAALQLDQTSSWKSAANGADYIIITHSDFYSNTLPLAYYRSSPAGGGYRVATVKVEDVYDEFNYGIFNPQAIRDFLSYAYYEWQAPAPTYVLLVGGASYDYRDLLADVTRVNYVPTQMIETFLLGQTASDNWFVEIEGDDVIPEMAIGRFTATSVIQVDEMVNKTIYYEQNPPDDSWNRNALYIADDDEISFEQLSESLAGKLPLFYNREKVYLADYFTGEDPTVDITNYINNGSALVNYAGHGNPTLWAGSGVYTVSDVNALTNTNKLAVVTVANCLSGFFVGKDSASMAEAFLGLPGNKGAVAVWAPTGLGYAYGHKALLEEFYNAIFVDDVYELGVAATIAKTNLYNNNPGLSELVETYVFFGDPATRIHVVPHNDVFMPSISNGE